MSNDKDGWIFYEKLNRPTRIVAPMVDQSELAWRLLSRRHGANLCYTPMFNARTFLNDAKYRKREFQTHPEDRPLIAQFCGNDPETILKAAQLIESEVDGIDINLGCPQNIAKRGHYGSFLQDEWDLIHRIISLLRKELKVPVTAKIRIFDDAEKTVDYARMICGAGASILTVHGRTREQKGQQTGLADWSKIKAVRLAIPEIPIFGNGNIMHADNIEAMMDETLVNGVMTAEGNLYNPAIFEEKYPLVWDIVDEYLDIVRKLKLEGIDTGLSSIRGHLFKMYRNAMSTIGDTRWQLLGSARSFENICDVATQIHNHLKFLYDQAPEKDKIAPLNHSSSGFHAPPWFCHSYLRPLAAGTTEVDQFSSQQNEIAGDDEKNKYLAESNINQTNTRLLTVKSEIEISGMMDDSNMALSVIKPNLEDCNCELQKNCSTNKDGENEFSEKNCAIESSSEEVKVGFTFINIDAGEENISKFKDSQNSLILINKLDSLEVQVNNELINFTQVNNCIEDAALNINMTNQVTIDKSTDDKEHIVLNGIVESEEKSDFNDDLTNSTPKTKRIRV